MSTAPMPWPGAYRARRANAWSAVWRVLWPALIAAGLLASGLRSSEWLAARGSAAEPPSASRGAPAAPEPLSGSPPLPQAAPPSPPPREPTQAPPSGPIVLPARAGGPEVHAFAPRPARAHAVVVVMLHGMCSEPALQCPQLAPAFETWGWLLCPRATLTCSDGDATWKRDPSGTIRAALERARADLAAFPDVGSEGVLVGFSLGALRVAELVASGNVDPFRRLVLVGARVSLDAAALERQGVERVLLAAGERDLAHDVMRAHARRLAAAGADAKFISLGEVGHELTPEVARALSPGLAWVRGAADDCGGCE